MPNVNVALPETSQTILRPAVLDIVKQVQEITKIDPKSKIQFPGDIQTMQTAGSEVGTTQDRAAIFGSDKYTFIEVEEDYDINGLGTTSVDGRGNSPVFYDEKLGVVLSPIYASYKVTINFKYRCTSKTEAIRWRDDMRIRASQMRDINLHSITYTYFLPLELLTIIKIIYEKRENYLGYGQSFQEYFLSNSSDRLKLISDNVGKDTRLGIAETQTRIQGIYGFEGIPEKPERDDSNGTWTISFSYSYTYDKPTGCNIIYPIMIHNQLLPIAYTHYYDKSIDLDKINKEFSSSRAALFAFESDSIMNTVINPLPYIRMPEFDDYVIPGYARGTGTAIMALCEVDTNDKKTLLNLNDMGSLILDKDILQFIREVEYSNICRLYKSIINITLYKNKQPTYTTTIDCDSDLNIKAVNPLNLRDQHRLRISLVTDLTLLDKRAIDRIKRYPKAFVKIIRSMNELLRNHPDLIRLSDKELISNLDFSNIYAIFTGLRYNNGSGESTGLYYNQGVGANEWPYLTNGDNYYGECKPTQIRLLKNNFIAGATPVQNNINTRCTSYKNYAFRDLDPRIVENYRKNNIGLNTVMTTGIVSLKKEFLK
jgi:hypothetical protein